MMDIQESWLDIQESRLDIHESRLDIQEPGLDIQESRLDIQEPQFVKISWLLKEIDEAASVVGHAQKSVTT